MIGRVSTRFSIQLNHRGVLGEIYQVGSCVGVKILASVVAVLGAAALTLACMVSLVLGTIRAVSVEQIVLRMLAVSADFVFGTVLLLGCIYLSTHLAVRILGVGNAEFPPPPTEASAADLATAREKPAGENPTN
jgi:hypothetical protein